jgi:hypothetical protein
MFSARKEVDFLICSIRICFQDRREDVEHIKQLLISGVDWHVLVKFSIEQKVVSLLLFSIQHLSLPVPAYILMYLKKYYDHIQQFNLASLREFIKLLKIFKEKNIPILLYKGFSIARFYGPDKLRQWGDLDILIVKKDIYDVYDIMLKNGYSPIWVMEKSKFQNFLNFDHAFPFRDTSGSGMVVEVHWSFVSQNERINLRPKEVWQRSTEHCILEHQIPTLSDMDVILSTCLHHGIANCWSELRLITDVGKIVTGNINQDWDVIIRYADSLDLKRSLLLGTSLAKRLFDIEIPAKLDELIKKDYAINKLEACILNSLFDQTLLTRSFLKFRVKLSIREKLKNKVKFLLQSIKPTYKDVMVIELPTYLYFVYYIIRIWRVLMLALSYVFNGRRHRITAGG